MRASYLAVLVIACGVAEIDVGIPLRHLPLSDLHPHAEGAALAAFGQMIVG